MFSFSAMVSSNADRFGFMCLGFDLYIYDTREVDRILFLKLKGLKNYGSVHLYLGTAVL